MTFVPRGMVTQPSCSAQTSMASVKAAWVEGHGGEAWLGGRSRALLLGAGSADPFPEPAPGLVVGVAASLGPAAWRVHGAS